MENAVSLIEHNHINKMHENLRRKLQESTARDTGGSSGLRSSILRLVVGENYEQAKEDLENYVQARSAFRGFQERALRYVQHGDELIQAIQTKRGFPGLASLSLAKQQEIHEKVLEHFEELKHNLKQIEKVEREQRLNDMRSTVWVVQAACLAVGSIVATYLVIDFQAGLFSSAVKVTNLALDDASTWLVNLINW